MSFWKPDKINRLTGNFFSRIRNYLFLWFLLSLFLSLITVFLFFDGRFSYYAPLFLFFLICFTAVSYIQVSGIWSDLKLMERLINRITNSNVDFNMELRKFSINSLKESISFLSAAFQKLILQIEVTREDIDTLSRKLSSTTDNIHQNTVSQKETTRYVVDSSSNIDHLLADIKNQIGLIEENTHNTLDTSKLIESNSEGINRLADELINLIGITGSIVLNTQKTIKENEIAINEIKSFISYTSRSIDELSNIAQEVEQNVSSTVKFQKMVLEEVKKSEDIISTYSQSIGTIKSTIASTSDTIDTLSTESDQINLIIEAIDAISKQTRLLSLNASIIASISRESGKSFNVVADEIHLLSEKTELSTREIALTILNIKNCIGESKNNIIKSNEIVDSAEKQSISLLHTLQGIIGLSRKSILNIQDIQHATFSQLRNFKSILQTTEDINRQCADIKYKNSSLQLEFESLQGVGSRLSEITNGLKNEIHGQLYKAKDIISLISEINDHIANIKNISSEISNHRDSIENSFKEVETYSLNDLFTLKDLSMTSYKIQSEYHRLETLTDYYRGMKPLKGGELVISYSLTDNPVIDPALISSVEKIMVISNIYEPLLEYSSSSDIKPLLCESFDISTDGSKITFYLKKNVYFHQGEHLTSRDVKYTFERLKQVYADNYSKLSQFLGPIAGFEDFIEGSDSSLRGIRLIDDYTFEIELSRPLVYYIQALCQLELAIVPYRDYYCTMPGPNGTGPFSFKKLVERDYLLLERNSNYHLPGIPYLDYLRFQDGLRYKDLFTKKAHIIPHVVVSTNDFSKFVRSSSGVIIEPIEIYSVNILILNTTKPPFNDPDIRKALLLAINREKLIKDIFANHNRKAESFIPPGILGHSPRKDLARFDLDKAKELIEKSKLSLPAECEYCYNRSVYPEGFRPSATIKFLFDTLDTLGIKMKYTALEDEEYRIKRISQPMNYLIWHADYLDPDNFLYPIFHSKHIDNLGSKSGWRNEHFDSLIENAQYVHDVEKRKQLYYDAEEILFEEVPAIPICYNKHFLAHRYELICPIKSVFPYFVPKFSWFFKRDD